MPELPEVETVRAGLARLLLNKKIIAITSDTPKSFPNSPHDVELFIINAKFIGARRRGKTLMLDLSSGYSLVTHLKMTGQLVFRGEKSFGAGHPNDSLIGALPAKSTRVVIALSDESTLFFNDQRKFGWMKLVPTNEIGNIPSIQKMGPEPLDETFSESIFFKRLQRRKGTSIKAAILDQTVLAGVGNIYADESLFGAGIHPSSIVKYIPRSRIKKLHSAIIEVLKLSIEKGGSTDKNYVNAEGGRGSYIEFAKVFRKENQPCPVCGREIIKIRVAGRGTHVCTKCQKLYKGSN
jgi:formamidopyrimidine-DNA glycosylase